MLTQFSSAPNICFVIAFRLFAFYLHYLSTCFNPTLVLDKTYSLRDCRQNVTKMLALPFLVAILSTIFVMKSLLILWFFNLKR